MEVKKLAKVLGYKDEKTLVKKLDATPGVMISGDQLTAKGLVVLLKEFSRTNLFPLSKLIEKLEDV